MRCLHATVSQFFFLQVAKTGFYKSPLSWLSCFLKAWISESWKLCLDPQNKITKTLDTCIFAHFYYKQYYMFSTEVWDLELFQKIWLSCFWKTWISESWEFCLDPNSKKKKKPNYRLDKNCLWTFSQSHSSNAQQSQWDIVFSSVEQILQRRRSPRGNTLWRKSLPKVSQVYSAHNNNAQQTNKPLHGNLCSPPRLPAASLLWYFLVGVCTSARTSSKDAVAVKVTLDSLPGVFFFYLHSTSGHEIHHLAPTW